ncbi:hypothetical protein K2Y11_09955 [bacterium]|nr:hypothetical protein [bacterium]
MGQAAGKPKLFISTGCSSSDILVAPLVAELQQRQAVGEIVAMGGEPLRELGARLIFDSTPLSTIGTAHGITMFLGKGFKLLKALKQIKHEFKTNPPDLAILVDNAGINFRVMSIAKQCGIPVLFYVPPELWSVWWFERGILAGSNAKFASIFQSQADEYHQLGLDAEWIGHPIVDLLDKLPKAPREVGSHPVIGLFPGSRRQEVKQLLWSMREGAALLQQSEPNAKFIICAANPMAHRIIKRDLPNWKIPVEVRYRQSHAVLSECHLAFACSGTVTLEATLMGVPIVAMYRLAGILDNLVQKLVLPIGKYNHFSLPNVLLGRKVVPELGNKDVNAERITKEALRLLRDTDARTTVLDSLAEVRPMLGEAGAVQRAADIAEKLMSGTSTRRSADRQAA